MTMNQGYRQAKLEGLLLAIWMNRKDYNELETQNGATVAVVLQ